MEKTRKSNFELLRIVCVIMIIALHYNNSRMGGALSNVTVGSMKYYALNLIEALGIVSVNAFVIITGYFSYKKEKVKISKVLYLFYLCIFYGTLIYFSLVWLGKLTIDSGSLIKYRDTMFDRWFIVIYSILYLLIPYINKLISVLNEKQLRTMITIGVIFFYLWPTIYTNTPIKDGGYGIVNFIILYLIGAYIAKYKNKEIPKYKTIIVYVICGIITTLLACKTKVKAYDYNQIFTLIGSVAFFLTFKNLNIKENKIINKLSTYTLSTYIIHENALLVTILFREVFKSPDYWNKKEVFLNMIWSVIGIYALCIIIETIRRLIMKKLVDDNINKIKYEIG